MVTYPTPDQQEQERERGNRNQNKMIFCHLSFVHGFGRYVLVGNLHSRKRHRADDGRLETLKSTLIVLYLWCLHMKVLYFLPTSFLRTEYFCRGHTSLIFSGQGAVGALLLQEGKRKGKRWKRGGGGESPGRVCAPALQALCVVPFARSPGSHIYYNNNNNHPPPLLRQRNLAFPKNHTQ